MFFADNLIQCFFPTYSLSSLSENDERFLCTVTASAFVLSPVENIQKELSVLNLRDDLKITITFGDADPISYYSTSLPLSIFLNLLSAEYPHQKGEVIVASIAINKKKVNSTITIYDLATFYSTIKNLSINQGLHTFSRIMRNSTSVNFEVIGIDTPFNTATLFFNVPGQSFQPQKVVEREKAIENLRSVGHAIGLKESYLVPEDFKVVSGFESNENICLLLNHYATIVSILYLFDITSILENELEYKINGYKSIKGAIDLANYPIPETDEYFTIYKWVYNGGNLVDKIGLSRNIISLHFEKSGGVSLKGNPFQSIQSSYKVYEKQNIKQYIEIRNKISDQLLDFNNRANKIIESFASGFQKSSLGIITFYFSAIAIKVLGKGEIVNVFTLDATLLSVAFLLGSLIYFFIARWEVMAQRKRFIDSYSNLKDRYTDLLDPEDINRILNTDKEYNNDLQFINQKLRNYSILWISFILILFFTTIILFANYNMANILRLPFWRYFF